MARKFLLEIVEEARKERLLSEEHFSVDDTLLEAVSGARRITADADRDYEPGELSKDVASLG